MISVGKTLLGLLVVAVMVLVAFGIYVAVEADQARQVAAQAEAAAAAENPPAATATPAAVQAPLAHSTAAPAPTATITETTALTGTADFDPEWTIDQLKSWITSGNDFEEQNARFWAVADWAQKNGEIHNTASGSEVNCLGIFPEFAEWGSHDSCGITQADPNLSWSGTLSVTTFDLVFKSRHDWGNTRQVILWNTPAIRFGQYGDAQATVTYPGSTQKLVCGREFELVPGMQVTMTNLTHGQHQLTYGETQPEHENECRPIAPVAAK